jgi:hypothetical protein
MLRTLAAARGALFLAVFFGPRSFSAQFFDVLSLGTLDPSQEPRVHRHRVRVEVDRRQDPAIPEFATSTSPGTIAVNAITNKAYYLGTIPSSSSMARRHARIAFTLTATPTLLAVNVATNKIYGVSANGVATVIDGQHARRHHRETSPPVRPASEINTATNKVYARGSQHARHRRGDQRRHGARDRRARQPASPSTR